MLTIRSRLRYDEEGGCSRQEAESGYVKRLFAYCGGALALDALLNPFGGTKPPENVEAIQAFYEEASTELVRTTAAAAAATIEVTGKNAMPLIRLALRLARMPKMEPGAGDEVIDKHIEATLAWLKQAERI